MHTTSRIATLILLYVTLACHATYAQDVPPSPEAISFLHVLQKSLKENNPSNVSQLVHYPFRAEIGHRSQIIHSRQEFVANYALIFTPARVRAIENAKNSDVWYRDQGYSIQFGTIWFDDFHGNFLLMTVNEAKEEAR